MKTIDWVVMFGWLVALVSYGLWRGRKSGTVEQFLLAGKSMPWYAMGLSIMATQASAITFISTTAQAYVDGMRFVQFYFGLPLAMILISAFAVPIFHNSGVYTAYEYLEKRFDVKTRLLVTIVFLIQRGLAAGISLYAPSVVLSVILGWPERTTVILMGSLVVLYTTMGGIKAVTWADVQQMAVILAALVFSLFMAISMMPPDITFSKALDIAGMAGRLNPVTTNFDPNDRYNIWSGLIGGMFLALAYFGTDQSQVQRYLTGKSVTESRISLLFNAVAKIPMQFLILFIGTMVYVFFVFEKPPVIFHPVEKAHIEQAQYDKAFEARAAAARSGDVTAFRAAQKDFDTIRKQAQESVRPGFNDTNYIFLGFVTRYLPVGFVGLVIGVIFSAAMSAISGEINSLATVSIIDVYKRYLAGGASDGHLLWASRAATAFWGLWAIGFASFGGNFGALIEAVNMIGSLFYGGMLGVFVLAFFFTRCTATGAFWGVLIGEAAIFYCRFYTSIAFLWYNVIGCVVVIAAAMLISQFTANNRRN